MNKFGSAVAAKPRKADFQALFTEARALHGQGRLNEAQTLYRQALKKRPDHFDTLHRLGVIEYLLGNPETAIQYIKRALMVERKSPDAHCNLATVLISILRFDEALTHSEKSITLNPRSAPALYNRGTALVGLRRYTDGIAALDASLALDPHCVDALNNRGSAFHDLNRYDDAIASYDQALALEPLHGGVWINKANALRALRRLNDALIHYDRGLSLTPNFAKGWNDRGDTLYLLQQLDEAVASYRKCLTIDSSSVEARLGCANVLLRRGQVAEAEATCEEALRLAPNSIRALVQAGQFRGMRGQIDQAIGYFDEALSLRPDTWMALSSKIFYLDFSETADIAQQQGARTAWWRRFGADVFERYKTPHINDRNPDRKLVLGYVSGDFNKRSPAHAIRPVLESHDKAQFEVVCYSTATTDDDLTRSFQNAADQWRDASQWSDDQLADCIRADKVDVLVDLAGHTEGNRLHVFARKPAPVQVAAWGFGTGTGLKSIDYMFSDPVALPVADRHHFAEEIVDLPSLMVMEPPPPEPYCAEPPVLTNGYLTYGVFNRVSKFSDAAIAIWSHILRTDPTSRLLIKDHACDDESVRRTLLARFESQDIAPERVSMLGATPREAHLQAFGQVDICLDPFPQNGGISTFEALYMGVPVISKLGRTIASRCAGAIVSAVGLPDWVAADDEQYVTIAWTATPERLKAIRGALPGMVAKRCSPAAYTRAVEDAYRTMWTKYCATSDAS